MTTWNPLTQPIDSCKLGGFLTPGLLEIAGASSPRKWDEQAAYAMSGAILIWRGIAPARFTMKFKLLTPEHWEEWEHMRTRVMRVPTQAIGKEAQIASSLDVDHPVLNELGIKHLVIEDVAAPEQVDDGVWVIEVKCIEFRPPVATPPSKVESAEATEFDPREQRNKEVNDENQQMRLALDPGNP